MKSKNLFIKIYISLLIICIIVLFTLSILGKKTRVGYLGEFKFDEYHINRTLELNGLTNIKASYIIDEKLDEEGLRNFIFTNEAITNYSYGVKLQYYSKVFRHSDIYGVYVDTNKVLKDNPFIKEIIMNEGGSPFGNLVSVKKIDFEKIDNINYILKIKQKILIYFVLIFTAIILYYLVSNYKTSITNFVDKHFEINSELVILSENGFVKKYHIINILFIIYVIFISLLILSVGYILPMHVDEWLYSSISHPFYNIFDFKLFDSKGNILFWERGRHFSHIFMRSSGSFTDIFTSFGFDPIDTYKAARSIIYLIYYFVIFVSSSIFVWLLNNKRNYKLIFISLSLFLLYICDNIDFVHMSCYIMTAGVAIFIWLPILYYYLNDKELVLFKNKFLYYSLSIILIYIATFSIEPSSLTVAGLSFFLLFYLINKNNKLFVENNNIERKNSIFIFFSLILFILFSLISFITTTFFSGRGLTQVSFLDKNDKSLFDNIVFLFRDTLNDYEKTLFFVGILLFVYIIFITIKNKSISKIYYIYFSMLFTAILGILGFFAIYVFKVWICLLLIFMVILSILLDNINKKTVISFLSGLLLSILITFMLFGINVNHSKFIYDNINKNPEKTIARLYQEAEKNNLDEIVLTKKFVNDNSLNSLLPSATNRDIPYWMKNYGYVNKVIKIIVVE